MSVTVDIVTPIDAWMDRASVRDRAVFRLARLSAYAVEWGEKAQRDISNGREDAAATTTRYAIGWAREAIEQIEQLERIQ